MKILLTIIAMVVFYKGKSQISDAESMFTKDFDFAMNDIKVKLSTDAKLTKKQKRLLNNVKEVLDYSVSSFDITSNSDTKIITYNQYAWLAIFRYMVSKEISKSMSRRNIDSDFNLDIDDVDFNRTNFFNFYNFFLKWLPENVDVIQQAELNDAQVKSLQNSLDNELFKFSVKKLIVLIYLHEFYHQIQKVNTKREKISKLDVSQAFKDSLYLNLEIECDSFALYKAADIRILPESFLETYSVVNTFKHNRSISSLDISKRLLCFFQMLYRAKDYFNEPYLGRYSLSSILISIKNIQRDIDSSKNISLSLSQFKQQANNEGDIEKLFSIGYLYLVDNPALSIKNIDSALLYFEKASSISVGVDSLKNLTKERALLAAGKIYELVKKDRNRAIDNFSMAREIAIYFPEEFYANLIKRLMADRPKTTAHQ